MTVDCALAKDTPAQGNSLSWLPVAALGVAAFVMVTTEFMPVGLLPTIAADLHQTEGRTGLMVTLPGLLAAVSAPAMIAFAGRLDRRHVLAGLLSLLALSNLIVFLSTSFELMLFGRALMGVAVGGFWTVGGSLGPRLQPGNQAKAGAVILSGVSLGMVAGVPAGVFLSELLGWRWAFGMAGFVALAVLALLLAVMPSLPASGGRGLRDVPALMRDSKVRLGFAAIVALFGGHFLAYTFVTPFLLQVTGIGAGAIGGLLLAYGVAAFAGNLLGGWASTRSLRGSVIAMGLLLGGPLLLLAMLGQHSYLTIGLLMVWGIAFGMMPIAVQSWLFAAAPTRLEAVQSVFVCLSQVAIGVGSLSGGLLADGLGVTSAFWASALVSLSMAALFLVMTRSRTYLAGSETEPCQSG